ncbi:hypothetical protein DEU56DRAFT_790213 [Suillus clintonianus]|uniref:uncharacterized protein n=1 Tax=Suillus clintonianus TaxID=1904413 RepID=UPI001B879340|nr:uncharacterized protein DEU56DRAFT_790213 [Suillus clintonianus]KAG2144541.1 hypothetical protein DEU56DRAFT_790213 [Suillus clintonianus]
MVNWMAGPILMINAFREHMSRYMKVAGLTILIYDYLVTMDKEVRLMWGSKWGIARVLFCISRYLPFVASAIYHCYLFAVLSALSDYDQCFPLYDAAMWLNAISICAAKGLLILRTYAMWKCNRKILYGLLAFVGILLTVAFVLEVKAGLLLSYGPPPSFGGPGCYPTKSTDVLYVFYLTLVITEFVILVLVLIQARVYSQQMTGPASGLLKSLYRDSIFYIVCLLLISIANVVVMSTIPPRYNQLFDTFPAVMHSVLSSRIMFNLRQSAYCDVHSTDISDMDAPDATLRFSVFGRV